MATINDAVRLMYLNQTGREADPGGLEYFAKRFGADSKIDEDELAIFRQMAPAEVAGQEARRAAAAAQQAAVVNQLTSQLTAAGMSPANFYASGGQLPVAATTATGGTTTAGTTAEARPTRETGMTIQEAYQQVLGRTPNAEEIAYWQTQFGNSVDAKELSTFSVAAQPERAAAPTTNNAIRQMYLSVLGREPDASGLKYFSDRFGADVDASELGIFRGMSTQELAANAARDAGTTTSLTGTGTPGATTSLTGTTTGTVQPITRPPPVRQVTSSQLAPASFAQTKITGTPFTNLYTPATVQQNAPRLSDIQAAAQSANPYQSLMSLTPQRTLSPAYAAQAGQTGANTNLGGYDSSLYSKPLTGLLAPSTVAGGGGTDLVNNSGDQRGPGTDNTGSGQTIYGGLANLAGEAQRYGFNTIGGLIAGAIPVGSTLAPGINATTADLAALGNTAAIAAINAQNQAIAQDAEGGSSGDDGGGGARAGGTQGATGGGYMAKGGMVTPRQVKGPNPPGPDDGYAALDNGEYVIRKSAVKKYGSNIFEQINAGKIPAQRLKSLLE